jgi:hypothetical protein
MREHVWVEYKNSKNTSKIKSKSCRVNTMIHEIGNSNAVRSYPLKRLVLSIFWE